jgi:hypothetical protein
MMPARRLICLEWRVHRLDQIRAHKSAKLFDFKALTLEISVKHFGGLFTPPANVTRPDAEVWIWKVGTSGTVKYTSRGGWDP